MNKYKLAFISLFGGALLVTAGCASHPRHAQNYSEEVSASSSSEKKLGTKWGEDVSSTVQTVSATRMSQSPYDTATIYYRGEQVPKQVSQFSSISLAPVSVRIIDDNGRTLPMYRNSQGRYTLPAQEGQRYQIALANTSKNKTYEVIATVDGIDVLNGRAGSYQNSGYLIRPNSALTIKGFRKNSDQVAAFRFASPEESYVNQNIQGDEQNIGVIGVAIFEVQEELPECEANAFPADNRYAPAPCRKR